MSLVITHAIAICKVDICPMAISLWFCMFLEIFIPLQFIVTSTEYMYENDSLIWLCSKLVSLHWGRRFKAEVV
jgi:hypothetical protein